WKLIDEVGAEKVSSFTIIPRTWELTAEEFERCKPAKLIGALRSALDESGAKGATGWIIAFLHGEWDPVGMVFRLHMHGFA
ncbi:hypothetical protein, partial [Klebsiella pneumoniae]|uniref:hypothetical protein n=1 Tax=Klebsiella pneumoniae TaxID=573 RepID=UPI00300BE3BC